MKKTKSESEIIADLHISDPVAFNHIFNNFYSRLVYFAEQYMNNRHEAEDIVLVTFQKFWERRNAFFKITNIKAFLYITVKNACLDAIRSNATLQKHTKQLAWRQSDEFEKSAELCIIETEHINTIYEQINSLPKKSQRVFKMKYVEGVKTSEIALRLNISESTVHSHIAYSLKLLRNALGSQLLMISLFSLSEKQKTGSSNHTFSKYSECSLSDPILFDCPQENLSAISN